MYKQVIIARKDLKMSPGKLAAQVSHASMAFLTSLLRNKDYITPMTRWSFTPWEEGLPEGEDCSEVISYEFCYLLDKDLYEQWICGSFTKCVCEARNKNHLLKAKAMADEMGLIEGKDFFLIKDNCRAELDPEEVDEGGVGRTLTCIGFRPMEDEIIDQIGKKYHLYV